MSIVLEGINTKHKDAIAQALAETIGFEYIEPSEDKIGNAYEEFSQISEKQVWVRWVPSEWVAGNVRGSSELIEQHYTTLGVKLLQMKGVVFIYTPPDEIIIEQYYQNEINSKESLRSLLNANRYFREFFDCAFCRDLQLRGLPIIPIINLKNISISALMNVQSMLEVGEF